MQQKTIVLSIFLGLTLIFNFSCKDKVDDTPPTEKIYDGNLNFSNLQQLQEFYQNGYTVINGDLYIQDVDSLKDMNLLSNLKRIHGNFSLLQNAELETLEGLNLLDTITGSFRLMLSHELVNLEGLGNLVYIGVDFRIMKCNSLVNLVGLNKLENVGLKFKVSSNHNMISLRGIENLKKIHGALEIGEDAFNGNDKLKSIAGLENLEKAGSVNIQRNMALSDFCAIENMIINGGVDGSFTIKLNAYNPTINDIEAGNCSQ